MNTSPISDQITFSLPYRIYIEKFSLFRMCGNLQGKQILDIDCGTGAYAIAASQRNALFTLGVDENNENISQAKLQAQHMNNVHFEIGCAKELPILGEFDIALGVYLLHQAQDQETLEQYVHSIYKNLKPGGKFVGINDNPGNAPDYYKKYKKYGFLKSGKKQRREGTAIIYTFFNENGSTYSLQSYYLSLETYEKVFLRVGFKDFRWKTLSISEKSKEKYSLDYWRTFLNHPPIIGIEALRD